MLDAHTMPKPGHVNSTLFQLQQAQLLALLLNCLELQGNLKPRLLLLVKLTAPVAIAPAGALAGQVVGRPNPSAA